MKNLMLIYTSRILLLSFIAGPVLRTAHLLIEEHINIYEIGDYKIEKRGLLHWCDHFLNKEHKAIILFLPARELLQGIINNNRNKNDVRISQVTSYYLKFYVRGPPKQKFKHRANT